jgi:hypothetical protein
MKPNGFGMMIVLAAAGAWALAGGCALQKKPTATVLGNRDFVADPGTMPTDAPPTRAAGEVSAENPATGTTVNPDTAPVRTISAAEASEGVFDVVAKAEAPAGVAGAAPSGDSILIDEKVGEINGRPIRVKDVFEDVSGVGKRLAAAARNRRLNAHEWEWLTGKFDAKAETRPLSREYWEAFASILCRAQLESLLQEELLESEARASLKPEQKQGLAWLVNEAGENLRRENAGSRAAAAQHLQEKQGVTEQQYLREHESRLLIEYEISEKIRKKVRTGWKDVRLYYERNPELYAPPPTARFRLIRVPGSDAEGIAKVQAALDAGEPFEKVAGQAPNTFHPEEGGMGSPLGDRTFTGEYATAPLNLMPPLEAAAHELTPGKWKRVDLGRDTAWLYLESITRKSRPLSDRDVQLEIAKKLSTDAESLERQNYIDHLKNRASFSDMDAMVKTLVEAAAERYWPKR